MARPRRTLQRHGWIAFVLSIAFIPFAHAAPPQPTEKFHACHGDQIKHCARVAPGQRRLTACLQAHESALTVGCKSYLTQMRRLNISMANACRVDARTLCAQEPPLGGQLAACLHAHREQLAPACLDSVSSR